MRIPKYRKNPDGRAFIERRGRRTYLGKYGTHDSKRRYEQMVRQIAADAVQPLNEDQVRLNDASIAELVVLYLDYAKNYYSDDNGPTDEYRNVKESMRPLLQLYATTPARAFGPVALDAVVEEMVRGGYARGVINGRLGRIKRCFKWCARRELLDVSVYQALLTVEGLKRGRTAAKEPEPVRPVAWSVVEATLPYLSPTVATMVQVQFFCGMRPAEVCLMRSCDIDATGDVWLYEPHQHKAKWRCGTLVKAIPKMAQKLLSPLLANSQLESDSYLFSPRDADLWKRYHTPTKANRSTPVYPSELRQRERRKAERAARRRRSRAIRDHYVTATYRQAIGYAVAKANRRNVAIPRWSPNQLRHTIATELRQSQGEQAAQVWLGHTHLSTTGIYAEKQVSELTAVALALEQHLAKDVAEKADTN